MIIDLCANGKNGNILKGFKIILLFFRLIDYFIWFKIDWKKSWGICKRKSCFYKIDFLWKRSVLSN